MNVLEFLQQNHILLDGGMGTLLQAQGLQSGESPERWNLTHPEIVTEIHRQYFNAGSNIINANTFGANPFRFDESTLDRIIAKAMENAKLAKDTSDGTQPKFIALDIGPSGKMLKPLGDLEFEDAVKAFSLVVTLGVKYGADLIFIETMTDSYETKAALLAAKENSHLPVFVSNAYSSDGKLMTGSSPEVMVSMLEGMGADAIGINCSFGPESLLPIVRKYLEIASVPVLFKPNAGLPVVRNGKTEYDVSPEEFSSFVEIAVQEGVRLVGGCCGTTPAYIRQLHEKIRKYPVLPILSKHLTTVSSFSKVVQFSSQPVLIGERINPTGKKRMKQALLEADDGYLLSEAVKQEECGVHMLDVNVGMPELDEAKVLPHYIREIQSVTDLPLQIDTSDPKAMEQALRVYNGKALINSVNGKQEVMDSIFPLVKKYGGCVIALTLDEDGIPETAEGRIRIAEKIIACAAGYEIDSSQLIFDPLAMSVSTSRNAALVTLESLKLIREKLGCHTSLGVSNISFGLPQRGTVNASFFLMALQNGLSAAIMNPYSTDMMKSYYSYLLLSGQDEHCEKYISFSEQLNQTAQELPVLTSAKTDSSEIYDLKKAIQKGLKSQAEALTQTLLKTMNPMDIIQNEIVPALDAVGKGFEQKTIYLPQLLVSAETAGVSFEVIKKFVTANATDTTQHGTVVLATVKGDIHDIGKNIVKLLLENYGYHVMDLGKDVSPEVILKAVIDSHAPLVGLSALMTTTVPAMEETIRLVHRQAPWCKVIVGGAVLTQEYADQIHADCYSKDAMVTVRYAESLGI